MILFLGTGCFHPCKATANDTQSSKQNDSLSPCCHCLLYYRIALQFDNTTKFFGRCLAKRLKDNFGCLLQIFKSSGQHPFFRKFTPPIPGNSVSKVSRVLRLFHEQYSVNFSGCRKLFELLPVNFS